MLHETVGCLMTVAIETFPVETRFLLCKDKKIRQNRSCLYPKLTTMSRSEALRPALLRSLMINMTKPHNDMYTHHQFTDLEQEYLYFIYISYIYIYIYIFIFHIYLALCRS